MRRTVRLNGRDYRLLTRVAREKGVSPSRFVSSLINKQYSKSIGGMTIRNATDLAVSEVESQAMKAEDDFLKNNATKSASDKVFDFLMRERKKDDREFRIVFVTCMLVVLAYVLVIIK